MVVVGKPVYFPWETGDSGENDGLVAGIREGEKRNRSIKPSIYSTIAVLQLRYHGREAIASEMFDTLYVR